MSYLWRGVTIWSQPLLSLPTGFPLARRIGSVVGDRASISLPQFLLPAQDLLRAAAPGCSSPRAANRANFRNCAADRLRGRWPAGSATPRPVIHEYQKQEPADRSCSPPVHNVGVDDWAWRKGQEYGTILVNLDLRRVVDLLPDRAAESLSEWLRQHAGIITISRDRCGLYAEGASLGAPQAQQVADRFHLILNLSSTMERVLEERSRQLILPPAEDLGTGAGYGTARDLCAGYAATDTITTASSTPLGAL